LGPTGHPPAHLRFGHLRGWWAPGCPIGGPEPHSPKGWEPGQAFGWESSTARAAAKRAMGTRYGEQET
jgi:hypothetical protein